MSQICRLWLNRGSKILPRGDGPGISRSDRHAHHCHHRGCQKWQSVRSSFHRPGVTFDRHSRKVGAIFVNAIPWWAQYSKSQNWGQLLNNGFCRFIRLFCLPACPGGSLRSVAALSSSQTKPSSLPCRHESSSGALLLLSQQNLRFRGVPE